MTRSDLYQLILIVGNLKQAGSLVARDIEETLANLWIVLDGYDVCGEIDLYPIQILALADIIDGNRKKMYGIVGKPTVERIVSALREELTII